MNSCAINYIKEAGYDEDNILECDDEFVWGVLFEKIRWGTTLICPDCGHNHIWKFRDGKRYKCEKCHHNYTIKDKTILKGSKLPLSIWVFAIDFVTKKKGSTYSFCFQYGITQKTAWLIFDKIYKCMNIEITNTLEQVGFILNKPV